MGTARHANGQRDKGKTPVGHAIVKHMSTRFAQILLAAAVPPKA